MKVRSEHTATANSNDEEEQEENIEIVRSIASYLSLSEVESLGSLYSLVSPSTQQSYPYSNNLTTGTGSHYNQQQLHHQYHRNTPRSNYLNTPRSTYLSSGNTRNSNVLMIREEDTDEYDHHYHANDNKTANNDDETIHSGPDAGAGFGTGSADEGGTSPVARRRRHYDDTGLDTPGLIALSPALANNNDQNDYDEDEDEEEEQTGLPLSSCGDKYSDRSYYQNKYNQNDKSIMPSTTVSATTTHSITRTNNFNDTNHKNNEHLKNDQLKQIQQKLQKEILSHPQSIRSYCLSSHQKAVAMRQKEIDNSLVGIICPDCNQNTMTFHYHQVVETSTHTKRRRRRSKRIVYSCTCQSSLSLLSSGTRIKETDRPLHMHLLQILTSPIFQNVPLSIIFDLSIQSLQTSGLTLSASLSLTSSSITSIIHLFIQSIHKAWTILSHTLNPFTLLDTLLSIQRKAMGISSEAIVTGIQSVATLGSDQQKSIVSNIGVFGGGTSTRDGIVGGGIGSVLSASVRSGSVAAKSGLSEWWRGGGGIVGSASSGRGNLICEKMFRKLKKGDSDSAAKVIKYIEGDDEVLTHHAKKRVQKMMHYRVPLRPFVATIEVPPRTTDKKKSNGVKIMSQGFHNIDVLMETSELNSYSFDENNGKLSVEKDDRSVVSDSESMLSNNDDSDSPFMCTPKSFPPTPSSRAHVMARGTKFAQDVVFLARDQLRVQEGLDSENAQTRAMAKALYEGRRLAVFNAADVGGGIHLSCGQHSASKVGNDLYCSARGMIPVLRNSFVYFEMTVSTPPLLSMMLHHASLSIGLSTLEMPLNALVGQWKGSVGLCSTGQIVAVSNWYSPLEPKTYGSGSTVGCLVYLDDGSAFETWDGVMVTANIVFNVDGQIIIPAGVNAQSQVANQTITNSTYAHDKQPDDQTHPSNQNAELNSVLPLYVPREEELFPTLTLHSTQTEVLCRFCASDILATSHRSIGAPSYATVYAVDGSVLFVSDEYQGGVKDSEEVGLSESTSLQSLSSNNDMEVSVPS